MGGPFLVIVGVCLILGALMPALGNTLLNIGFILGGMSFMFSWKLSKGLPKPRKLAYASIIAAISLEILVFIAFSDQLKALGARDGQIATLGIVAAHFLIFYPAYGLAAALLALLCGTNALIGFLVPAYSVPAIVFVDGLMKAVIGVISIRSSPVFQKFNV